MLSLFGFGKRHRSRRHSRKSVKPPAALLKMCRKLKIKTTSKKGGRRVYRKVSVLKKLLRHKKKMLLRKKKMLLRKKSRKVHKGRKKSRKVHKGHKVRKYRKAKEEDMEFGGRTRFGAVRFGAEGANEFGASSRRMAFGNDCSQKYKETYFGKRRSMASRKKAMTAFRKFYKRYCKVSPVRRRKVSPVRRRRSMRFGEGGNPPLWKSMGYEVCPMGQGGVLETTGLFASPCSNTVNEKVRDAEMNAVLPTYGLTGLTGMLTPVLGTLSGASLGGSSFGERRGARGKRYKAIDRKRWLRNRHQ